MISPEEARFYQYWGDNRIKNRQSFRPLLIGMSIGFAIGVGILLTIYLGWYTRANMQVNSIMNPFVFLLAILGVSVFMAFIYRNYQWEMKEQRYLIIKARMVENEKKQTDAALAD
jgi:hypothetical protein